MNNNRDYYFDNVKFLLVTLVLVGHSVEPLIGNNQVLKALYLTIYSFHIPAFALISGYFSKGGTFSGAVTKVLIPYIVFQALYSSFNSLYLQQGDLNIRFFNPYWIMWYLLALFLWKILLPFFRFVKYPILISTFISILAGYFASIGYFLSLSRILVFLPFFLVGYYIEKSHIERYLFRYPTKIRTILSGLFFTLLFLIFLLPLQSVDVRWFYGSYGYNKLGGAEWFSGGYRLAILLLAAICSWLLLWAVPKNKTFFSSMGQRTFYPYLLHGFFIKTFVHAGSYSYINSYLKIVLLPFAGVLLSIFLSTAFVQKITKFIVQPSIKRHSKSLRLN